jgi:hypothetical protein
VPDGKEIYMSPLWVDLYGNGEKYIIYGTGGETIGGQLFISHLDDLLNNDLSRSLSLVSREGHGFIAPPTLTDLTGDGIVDIITNWHGGEMIAVDGDSKEVLWTYVLPGTELNNSPTPGDINHDGIADFFSTFSQGSWPKNTNSIPVVIDGANGQPLYKDTHGCTGFATALSYDFNEDGSAEFLWNTNEYNCTGIYLANNTYRMIVLDYSNNHKEEWVPSIKGKNISSTPWLGDLYNDGSLDLVYCIQANYNDIYSYHGIRIIRMDIGIPDSGIKSWTEYMGKTGNGIY